MLLPSISMHNNYYNSVLLEHDSLYRVQIYIAYISRNGFIAVHADWNKLKEAVRDQVAQTMLTSPSADYST